MQASPCKDCTDRILGCHSSCDRYSAFKDKIKQESDNKYQWNQNNQYFIDRTVKIKKQKSRKKY